MYLSIYIYVVTLHTYIYQYMGLYQEFDLPVYLVTFIYRYDMALTIFH